MEKNKFLTFIFILIYIMFLTTNTYAQLPFPYFDQKDFKDQINYQNIDNPTELNLNSQYIFDKDKIQEWVKYNSWEKAYDLVWNNHTIDFKKTYGKAIDVTLITPVVSWIKENYIGSLNKYDKNTVKKNYIANSYPLELKTKFILRIMSTDQDDINLKNYNFILEDNKKEIWQLDKDNIIIIDRLKREFIGKNLNNIILEIEFHFYDKTKIPDFDDKIILHIINERKNKEDKFIWQFEKKANKSFSKQILIEDLINGYLKLDYKNIIDFSNKIDSLDLKQKIDNLVSYISKENEKVIKEMFENVFSKKLSIYSKKVQKALLIKILDQLEIEEISILADILSDIED